VHSEERKKKEDVSGAWDRDCVRADFQPWALSPPGAGVGGAGTVGTVGTVGWAGREIRS